MPESVPALKHRAASIYRILRKTYPDAWCTLDYRTDFQLMVAAMLSAQAADVTVNRVTPSLFKRFPDAAAMARAKWDDVDRLISAITYHGAKAEYLIEASKLLVEKHGGKVPESMEDLTALPGIGRKIANVIRGTVFYKPAVIVDTHFLRVTTRLGLHAEKTPEKIERVMMTILPETRWTIFSHLMLFHGRAICRAPRPLCPRCPVITLCHRDTETRKRPRMKDTGGRMNREGGRLTRGCEGEKGGAFHGRP